MLTEKKTDPASLHVFVKTTITVWQEAQMGAETGAEGPPAQRPFAERPPARCCGGTSAERSSAECPVCNKKRNETNFNFFYKRLFDLCITAK